MTKASLERAALGYNVLMHDPVTGDDEWVPQIVVEELKKIGWTVVKNE
jgi:hypothetical protein